MMDGWDMFVVGPRMGPWPERRAADAHGDETASSAPLVVSTTTRRFLYTAPRWLFRRLHANKSRILMLWPTESIMS